MPPVCCTTTKGERVARYDKLHLFDVRIFCSGESYNESETILSGRNVVVVDTPFGRLGLAVCYDLRFPELFRRMLNEGMEIVALPAAFTAITGRAPLGEPDPGPVHREPLLCHRRRAGGLSPERARDLGSQHVGRSLGHGDGTDPSGIRGCCCRNRSGAARFDPAQLPRA